MRKMSPEAGLERAAHFARAAFSSDTLMQLLEAEARHPESWLQACEDGVRALIRGSFLPAAAAADFPQSFLDLAAFEPLTVSKALRRARKSDGAGCGPLFPPVLEGETLPPASFQCAHCEALFATHQQLSVHEFAAHGVRTTAEDFLGATNCNCCFTQFMM